MFLSETEGTGIKLSETEGTGMSFSESEGTDIKTEYLSTKFLKKLFTLSCLLLIGQITMADVGYIHETKQDGVYQGMIVDNIGNNVLFEGVIENKEFTGFVTQIVEAVGNLTDSVDDGTGGDNLDSVDDGTGGYTTDSVDDGTGGILNSLGEGTGKLISISLTCDSNNNFEVSVESKNSLGTMVNFKLTSLYLNGIAQHCNETD